MIRTTIEPGRLLEELQPHRRALRMRLAALRRRLRWQLALEGIAWTVGLALVLAGTSLVVDLIVRFSLPTRLVLLSAAVFAIVCVAWRKLIQPLRLPLVDLDLAEIFNRRHPGVGERMATVLQLPRQLEGELWVSPTMIRAAVIEHARHVEQVDLASAIDRGRSRKMLGLLALAMALPVVVYLVWPTIGTLWTRRWLLAQDVRWPQSTYLSVIGAKDGEPLMVPRGEAFVIQVSANPKFEHTDEGWELRGRGTPLVIDSEEPPSSELPGQVSIEYESESESHHGNFTRYEASDFRYELPPVVEDTEFSVRGGDDWLGPIEIEPVDRPTIKSLTIVAHTPGTSEAQEIEVGKSESQLLFLPTTKMRLRLTSTEPLAEAEILGKGEPLPKLVRSDATTYTAEWEMKESLTLEVRLVGERASLSSKPYFLSIGLLHDRDPRVTVRSTGVGRRVTPMARIPLNIRAVDDFGVIETAVELEQTVVKDDKPESKTHKLHSEKPPADQGPQVVWERTPEVGLTEFTLAPGNTVRLRGLAVDNCLLGSHTGYSRWISLQVVSPEELFYEILMRQRDQRQKFNNALQSAKKQADVLAQLTDQEEAIGLVRSQQVVARQVWQIAGQLEATLLEMTYNDLGSEQARELLSTGIIAPMRGLHDDQLSKLRAQFETLASQKAIKAEDRDAASKLQAEANTIMQQILDKMSQWESFVDVVNQLKQVIKSQNGLLQSTEEMRKNIVKDLFDK